MIETQNPDQGETSDWIRVSKRSSRARYILVGLICATLVLGVGVFVVVHSKPAVATRRQHASAAAATFLRTWTSGNLSALPAQTVTGSAAVDQIYTSLEELGIAAKPGSTTGATPTSTRPAAGLPVKVELGSPLGSGELITVPAAITINVPGLGPWRYPVKLRVRASGNRSPIDWSPQAAYPTLKADDHFQLTRTVPRRAPIHGSDGKPLPVSADIRALIGTVGPASATQAKADPTLRVGEPIGQSGLQGASNAILRGLPSGELNLVNPAGHSVATLSRGVER